MAKREISTMRILNYMFILLTVLGALNWGLIGLLSFDMVAALFGSMSILSRIIYILFAFSGIYCIVYGRNV